MTTNDMFRKIYTELKDQLIKNSNEIFLKEYEIPSINYNAEDTQLEDHYFTSGIEMELDRMLQHFDNKVFVLSYQDKYFFSNDEETVKKALLNCLEENEIEEKSI